MSPSFGCLRAYIGYVLIYVPFKSPEEAITLKSLDQIRGNQNQNPSEGKIVRFSPTSAAFSSFRLDLLLASNVLSSPLAGDHSRRSTQNRLFHHLQTHQTGRASL